jgi:hypothetical protein
VRSKVLAAAVVLVVLSCAQRAFALPVFAHRYGVSCSQCHTIVPHLNAFGEAFLRAGYRAPRGMEAHGAFPVALKINLAYSSAPSTLPKFIVDEVELLAGAPVGKHFSYRLEQYLVDGGVPGMTRDAWLRYTSRPVFGDFGPAFRATGGEFTLPLPVDPETQRDTLNHYAVFDQTVGSNPFNFFADRIGLDAAYGREGRGFDFHIVPLKGHDSQSGLPTSGLDLMEVVQAGLPALLWSAYRYDGTRPLQPLADRFWREALALSAAFPRTEVDGLAQTGFDTSALGGGLSSHSAGGYIQARRALGTSALFVTRYDFATDTLEQTAHTLTVSLIIKTRRNSRLTIESVLGSQRSFNAAWLFAY